MNDPTEIFPNETYLNGLRIADATVVDAIFNEFRQTVTRAVESAGGSFADGKTFFRVAVLQTAELVHADKYQVELPISLFLKNLALAHYASWLFEKGQPTPTLPVPTEEEVAVKKALPSEEALREMRDQIRAKRQFNRLSAEDQKQILSLANSLTILPAESKNFMTDAYSSSIGRYKALLNEKDAVWDKGLPAWAITALTDTHFHLTWSACEAIERRLTSSQIPQQGENKMIRYAFFALLIFTIGYAAFTWFFRDRTPAEVYDNNFDPPVSILDDQAARYAHDSIAPTRPESCTLAFSEADVHYKKREWAEAAASLYVMMDDSLSVCQSDALFYLSIVGLQLNRPEVTVECISKIEDLDRYGEDLYWYMALAYVKMAAQDPAEKDTARRALERALSNTEIPKRRAQAEKMLEELMK